MGKVSFEILGVASTQISNGLAHEDSGLDPQNGLVNEDSGLVNEHY